MEATTILEGRWSNLPRELLESISNQLPLIDSINFRAVCQHWRSSSSAWLNVTNCTRDQPWLMFYDLPNGSSNNNNDGSGTTTCYFYSPYHAEYCVAQLPHLQGATVVNSKLGWLLVHRHDDFFLLNPFSLDKVNLPKHAIASDQVYSFKNHPRSSYCTAVIVSRWNDSALELSVCPVGASEWSNRTINVSSALFGTLTCVEPFRNQISIVGSKDLLVYEDEGRLHLTHFAPAFRAWMHREMVEIQQRGDWLRAYGDSKGILIRIAEFRRGESGYSKRGSLSNTVSDDEAPPGSLQLVKATWVEPVFD